MFTWVNGSEFGDLPVGQPESSIGLSESTQRVIGPTLVAFDVALENVGGVDCDGHLISADIFLILTT